MKTAAVRRSVAAGVDLIFIGFLNEATNVSSLNVNKPVSGSLPLPLSNHTTLLSHSYSLALCPLLRCVCQHILHTYILDCITCIVTNITSAYCMMPQILCIVEEQCAVIFLNNETYSFLVDDKRGKIWIPVMTKLNFQQSFITPVFSVT